MHMARSPRPQVRVRYPALEQSWLEGAKLLLRAYVTSPLPEALYYLGVDTGDALQLLLKDGNAIVERWVRLCSHVDVDPCPALCPFLLPWCETHMRGLLCDL